MPFHIWHGGQDPFEAFDKVNSFAARFAQAQMTAWPES